MKMLLKALLKLYKQETIDLLLKETFTVIDPKDILRISPNQAFFGDKEIPSDTIDQLVRDAERLRRSLLWQVLSRQMRYEASKLIAYQSKTTDDMIGGKMMLY